MLAIFRFTFLAVFHVALCASSSVQTPTLTDCSGGQKTNGVEVQKVTVSNAKAGQTVSIDAQAKVTESVGKNAQLQLSLARPNGSPMSCIDEILPCTLNLCGGTTEIEQEFAKEWNNKCPVQPGTYDARINFDIPTGLTTKLYFGNGKVVVTAKIVDGDLLYSCETFTVKFDV